MSSGKDRVRCFQSEQMHSIRWKSNAFLLVKFGWLVAKTSWSASAVTNSVEMLNLAIYPKQWTKVKVVSNKQRQTQYTLYFGDTTSATFFSFESAILPLKHDQIWVPCMRISISKKEIVLSGRVKTTSSRSVAFISQRNELGCVLLYHYNYYELR